MHRRPDGKTRKRTDFDADKMAKASERKIDLETGLVWLCDICSSIYLYALILRMHLFIRLFIV